MCISLVAQLTYIYVSINESVIFMIVQAFHEFIIRFKLLIKTSRSWHEYFYL